MPAAGLSICLDPDARTARDDSCERPLRVKLADGRVIAGVDAGSSDDRPVFSLAASGPSLASHLDPALARAAGVRLLAIDRPGLGNSTAHRGRTLVSFARDVEAVADELGLDRFAVVGWSGGAAHALAVAQALPARVRGVGFVSGHPPLVGGALARLGPRWARQRLVASWAPWLARLGAASQARAYRRSPEAFVDRAIASASAAEISVLTLPEHRAAFAESTRRLFAQGGTGLADEALALVRDWGFSPADVQAPVQLWHGEADPVVPIGAARWLAEELPHARLTTFPGEGHRLHLTHAEEILRAFAA